jgi:hypothetical protein
LLTSLRSYYEEIEQAATPALDAIGYTGNAT